MLHDVPHLQYLSETTYCKHNVSCTLKTDVQFLIASLKYFFLKKIGNLLRVNKMDQTMLRSLFGFA